jgi:hypothetical protein
MFEGDSLITIQIYFALTLLYNFQVCHHWTPPTIIWNDKSKLYTCAAVTHHFAIRHQNMIFATKFINNSNLLICILYLCIIVLTFFHFYNVIWYFNVWKSLTEHFIFIFYKLKLLCFRHLNLSVNNFLIFWKMDIATLAMTWNI